MGLEEGTSSGEGTWFGEGIKCFNNEPVDNEFRYECMNDSGDGSSGSNDIAMALIEEELGHPCISRTSVQTTTDA
ncbi:hypothetical protein V6N13_026547 [Hibiscus sabdariffa]